MNNKIKTYLELLNVCLQETPKITKRLFELSQGHIDWIDLLNFAARQGVIGVYWHGMEKLFKSSVSTINKPTDDDVMEWWGEITDIKKRNEDLFKKTEFVSRTFKKEGFDNCILKGQGNALMYPDPFLRTPGDIDIWLKGEHNTIQQYITKMFPNVKSGKLHIDFPIFKDTLVEVHYTPSYLANPFANKRLQTFFAEEQEKQNENKRTLPNGRQIPVPTPYFNVIFQLSHILRHYMYEGITLKQLVDYFYTLKEFTDWKKKQENQTANTILLSTLKKFGLLRFAQVVMYIMQELGLSHDHLYSEINEKGGKIVLGSILYEEGGSSPTTLRNMNDLSKFSSVQERQKLKTYRALKLLPYFPGETIWGFFPRIKGALSISKEKHP